MEYFLVAIALSVLGLTNVRCANVGRVVDDVAKPRTRAIIIDAGSMGSRVNLFTFHRSVDGQLMLDKSYFNGKKPGLSAYAQNPKGVDESLEALLDEAKAMIPQEQWSSTPVSLRATAGLRLLRENESQAILDECKRVFASFGFKVTGDSVAIMDGSDEGIFSWMTTNFLLGKFDDLDNTVATLDLGGGSNEVTFAVAPGAIPANSSHAKNIHRVSVLGKNVSLFSQSFLGMGIAAARKEIITHPDNGKSEGDEVTSECMSPSVSKMEWNYGGKSYVVSGPKVGGSVAFDRCIGIIKKVVRSAIPLGLPNLKEREIYAFGYYVKGAVDAGLIDTTGGKVTVNSFHKLASTVCENPITDMPFICLDILFIYVLLRDGFGLDETSYIFLYRDINGHRLNWALGAAFKLLQNDI